MMACRNPRIGTKIEKRTRTEIVAETVTEIEGETGTVIGIGTGTGIGTETRIAKVGITVKDGNSETVLMITESVILKEEENATKMGIVGIVLGLVQGVEIEDLGHVQEASELVDSTPHPRKQWVQHFQLFQPQATMYGNKANLGSLASLLPVE